VRTRSPRAIATILLGAFVLSVVVLSVGACGGSGPEPTMAAASRGCVPEPAPTTTPLLFVLVEDGVEAVDPDGRRWCVEPAEPAESAEPAATSDLGGIEGVGPVLLHPDGTHRVVGGRFGGEDGVWAVPVDGGTPERLASGNDVAATELAFSSDASRLWFAAAHGRDHHLHVIDLVPVLDPDGDPMIGTVSDDVDPATGAPLGILPVVSHPLGIGAVVAHHADPTLVAYAGGTCGDRRATLVSLPGIDATPTVVDLSDGPAPSIPVGFLDAPTGTTRVVVALSADGCGGPWDLWSVDVRDGAVTDRAELVRGVDGARIQVAPQEPAYTFVDVDITGFV
jgi:hypothetical protein